jgi:hypothetical protein
MNLADLLAIGLLAAFAVLLIVRTGTELRWPTTLRSLPQFDALRRAIERAVESGQRVHLSLGTGTLIGGESGPALAGLTALSQTAEVTLESDRPVVVSSGDGAVAAASQDALRGALGRLNAADRFRWTSARMLGPTPFSYVATLPGMLDSERVSVHVLIGHFGSEGGLAADMAPASRPSSWPAATPFRRRRSSMPPPINRSSVRRPSPPAPTSAAVRRIAPVCASRICCG